MEEAQRNSNKEQTTGKPTDKSKRALIIYKTTVKTDFEDLKTRCNEIL